MTWYCSVEEQEREAGLPRNDYILAVASFIVLLAHGAPRRARSSKATRFVVYHRAAARVFDAPNRGTPAAP
jgi:hypothetical protein